MIRRLTPADADAFYRLRLLGLETSPEAFATVAAAWRAASPERAGAALQSAVEGRFVLGAFEGNDLVGQVGVKREGRPSVRHKAGVWGLVVHPDHRRRGTGARLLQAAIDEARACEGLHYLRAVVTVSGDAIRLFESAGFVRYGMEAGGLRIGDAAHDQAFLRFELVAP